MVAARPLVSVASEAARRCDTHSQTLCTDRTLPGELIAGLRERLICQRLAEPKRQTRSAAAAASTFGRRFSRKRPRAGLIVSWQLKLFHFVFGHGHSRKLNFQSRPSVRASERPSAELLAANYHSSLHTRRARRPLAQHFSPNPSLIVQSSATGARRLSLTSARGEPSREPPKTIRRNNQDTRRRRLRRRQRQRRRRLPVGEVASPEWAAGARD